MSMAVINESVQIGLKVLVTIFPPVCIELGIIVYGKFESHFKDFTAKHVNKRYTNYKISYMFIMFTVDFFLYLFLGYYLQNIISHEFGISKPFYFLCTKTYWYGKEKRKKNTVIRQNLSANRETANNINNNNNSSSDSNSIDNQNDLQLQENDDPNFQSEELYQDRTGKKDSMKIRKLVKRFDDGKVAVNGVSLNLYRDEIFALLGHNGAGKSTMISMLCGLYDSTAGSAFYDGVDILEGSQMEIFRTKLGICPQHDVLFDDLTIEEHLSMFSTFKGVASNDIQEEVDKILKDFQLEDMKNIVAKNSDSCIDINDILYHVSNQHKIISSLENTKFVLSLFGKCFEKNGTKIYISKKKNQQ
jgi:ATP-binding cassette subfamily A (ABC1) protein 3